MTEKYRKSLNKPIKKWHDAISKVYKLDAPTKSKKVLKGSALVGMGLVEFMMRFSKWVALDNKILRKLEKKLSEIKVGKDKEGNEKKFQRFVKRNPNLSAVVIWWVMLGMLVGFGNVASARGVEKDGKQNNKELDEGDKNYVNNESTIEFAAVQKQAEIINKLNTPMVMADKESVERAVMENFAYTEAVLFATENYRTDWFSDNINGVKNTLGVGLYYIPNADNAYDFTCTTWAKASTMFNAYPKLKGKSEPRCLTDDEVYEGIEGWFFYMDNGYNFKFMRNALAGTNVKLTGRDLTVIASVLFNSPDCCKKFCDFIVKHPNDREEWAKYLLRVDDEVSKSRLKKYPGLKSRRVHEILVLLNIDNYGEDLFGIQIDGKRSTAVSFANNYFMKLRKNFSDDILIEAKNVICNGVVPNGHSICEFVQRSDKYSEDVFAYCSDIDAYLDKGYIRQQTYDKALANYNKKDYAAALAGFNEVLKMDGVSPELFNDLAITYIHYGDYDASISMSEKTLQIGTEESMVAAYFNMGLAYENKGDIENASKFYTMASLRGNVSAKSRLDKLEVSQEFKEASNKVKKKGENRRGVFSKSFKQNS